MPVLFFRVAQAFLAALFFGKTVGQKSNCNTGTNACATMPVHNEENCAVISSTVITSFAAAIGLFT